MSRYLLKETKKFRADSQMEADSLVEYFKKKGDVTSSRIIRKDKRDETYFIVEITISVNNEKEPFTSFTMD